jgi:flagellar protein FlbD
MIPVTRLDGTTFHVNPDLIETIDATPDTLLTLTTQKKLMVRESPAQVIDAVVAFRHRILAGGPPAPTHP